MWYTILIAAPVFYVIDCLVRIFPIIINIRKDFIGETQLTI